MWYAVAPELADPPSPPAMVRRACSRHAPPAVAKPSLPAEKSSPFQGGSLPAASPSPAASPVQGASLPRVFAIPLSLPPETVSSERQALRWICQRLSLHLDFHGPDYALYGAGVPFGKPVQAIELMRDLAVIPYIQGTVTVRPRSVTVRNAPLR